MNKLINVIKPNEPIPSLDNRLNEFGEDLYEMQRLDGHTYRLLKSQYEAKRAEAVIRPGRARKIDKRKYSKLCKGHHDYWEFVRHLAKNGKIGGFQCVESKEDQLKIDYFNATGEELEENQYNSDLSPDTWGNAMRVYFPEPENLSIEEINDLLPGDVEAKKWAESTDDLVISRMPYVLELLSMGFRHGKDHNVKEIEETIKKFQSSSM